MSQALAYGSSPFPHREPVDVHDWRLTRSRAVALAIVAAVLVAVHLALYWFLPSDLFATSDRLDGPLTLGLFLAHFFAAACATLRWCNAVYTTRWTRTHSYVLAALGLGAVVAMAFMWHSIRAGGVSELWLLPPVLFLWWWQGLKTGSGLVAGYAVILIMWWALLRAGGGLNEINLLPLLVFVLFYGALYGRPWLLGYLYIYLFAVRFVPDYLLATTVVAALLYTTLPTFVRSFRDTANRLVPTCYVIGLFLLASVLMPVVYLSTNSSMQDLSKAAGQADIKGALMMSLFTSGVAMAIVTLLGVPLAYALARATFPGKSLVLTAADLPIVIPPPIAGIALLLFLGPRTPVGVSLNAAFAEVINPNSSLGQLLGGEFSPNVMLIILAQVFVSSPFLIRACLVAFQGVDSHYERVARTLGATSLGAFRRVTLPLAVRGIVAGMILCWLRALAEYGSINVLAFYPKTAPILAIEKFNERGSLSEVQPIAVLILVMSLAVFLAMWLVRVVPARIKAIATA